MTEQMYRNHYAPLQLPAPGPHYSDPEYPDVDVAIIMESTYPYLKGGVSAVVHDIVCENPDPHLRHYSHRLGHPTLPRRPLRHARERQVGQGAVPEPGGHPRGLRGSPRPLRTAHELCERQRAYRAPHGWLQCPRAGDVNPLWKLYDEGINPATRSYNLFGLFGTREFMQAIAGLGFFSEAPFGELFWKVRDFVSILFAILHERMPHARVYHAHTTGYAALIAAAAARDHGTSFLLTEHNLYIRDTVNTKLERNMARPVTTD